MPPTSKQSLNRFIAHCSLAMVSLIVPYNQPNDRDDADSRLKELILYIAWFCQENEILGHLGATKLNKILFYSDFGAYLQLGRSITGQSYFALQYGPAPRRLKSIRAELESDKEIAVHQAQLSPGYSQQIFVPLRKSNLTIFTSEEIAIVDRVMVRFLWKNARETSDASHEFMGWIAAGLEEDIPYSSALLDAAHILDQEKPRISKLAIEHARRLEEQAKLALEKYG